MAKAKCGQGAEFYPIKSKIRNWITLMVCESPDGGHCNSLINEDDETELVSGEVYAILAGSGMVPVRELKECIDEFFE